MTSINVEKYTEFDANNESQWANLLEATYLGDAYHSADRIRFIYSGSLTVDIYGEFPPYEGRDLIAHFLGAEIRSINVTGAISVSSLQGVTLGDVLESNTIWDIIDQNSEVFYYGSDFHDDEIVGGHVADWLNGLAGNDTISGLRGNDEINGGEGNDTLVGGLGADWLYGGDGFDVTSYAEAKSGVTVMLGKSSKNTGEAKGDLFNSIEGIVGSQFKDRLSGDSRNNSLDGGAGNDRLTGGAGQDLLTGDFGKDVFVFGYSKKKGVERFDSGLNEDTWDVVTDFVRGQDKIEFDQGVNSTLKFIGTRDFYGKGQVRFERDEDGLTVFVNTDTDRAPEMAIRLDDVFRLSAGDFIL
ncbi:MAG: hypothetical protein KDJ29_05050 [Hyphomicrobiales bacterium]|nr:hypothetical protein [Hyphomicrobiales bacterium]